MKKLLSIIALIIFLLSPTLTLARTTPQDQIDDAKQAYNQKVKNYSAMHQQQLSKFTKDIATLNKEETDYLENLVLQQGEILDEYVKRNNINENGGSDGVHRNQDPVSVARIQITRAHESIAFQAAKIYILNLTSENGIKNSANNLISNLQSDLDPPKQATIYSQSLVQNLVKNK